MAWGNCEDQTKTVGLELQDRVFHRVVFYQVLVLYTLSIYEPGQGRPGERPKARAVEVDIVAGVVFTPTAGDDGSFVRQVLQRYTDTTIN